MSHPERRWQWASRLLGAMVFVVTLCPTLAAAKQPRGPSPEELVMGYLGDPQLGYTALEADHARFVQVLTGVGQHKLDVVVIPGDLTQDHSLWQRFVFSRAIRDVGLPLLMVPGNHDVDDLASLEQYRRQFGPDYFVDVRGEFVTIAINSETARSAELDADEHARHWEFLSSAFAQHRGRRITLLMHRPPFVRSETERDTESNWPLETRSRLLALCRQAHVQLILAGHLHRTLVTQTQDGIQIRVLPGSAKSFDASPIGFEVLTLSTASTAIRYVKVAPAPKRPLAVPGLRDWTPRLFDFSLRHWIFTLLYGAAGWLALRAHRQMRARRPNNPFGVTGWIMLFFAANMQLDIDELLREVGRIGAKLSGVSPIRHWITGVGLIVLLTAALVHLARAARKGRRPGELIMMACTVFPISWFILSAISHHHLRMLFDEFYWDVLCLLAIGVVARVAWTESTAPED